MLPQMIGIEEAQNKRTTQVSAIHTQHTDQLLGDEEYDESR